MKKFKKIYIEISNICNLQCSFCPVVERDKKIMSAKDFECVVNKTQTYGETFTLHLMGEPLAHPECHQILSIAHENNLPIEITTNGLFLDQYSEDIINYKNIRQINFSLHSFHDNFPDRSIIPYLQNILLFCDEVFARRPELYINLRLWTLGEDQSLLDFNREVMSYVENYYKKILNESVDVTFKKSKKILQRLYFHFDSRFTWPNPHHPPLGNQGHCHGGSSQIAIHANGTVVPCCLDKEALIPLGSIFDSTMDEILQSKRYQSLVDGFSRGLAVEDLCQRCTFKNRFKSPRKSLS